MLREELIDLRENTLKLQNKYFVFLRAKLAATLCAAFFVIITLTSCSKKEIQPQQVAPNFSFVSIDGSVSEFSSYVNQSTKPVLLVFWSTWCDVCKTELPQLESLSNAGKYRVLAVAIRDQKSRWINFVQNLPYKNIDFVFADTKIITDKYYNQGVPESFVVNESGRILEFFDPVTGQNTTKVVGGRKWSEILQ
jgi:thiol-disulfide isomerase/thioredoxin